MSSGAGFNLPQWSLLSSEQEQIINFPVDKNYLVQGSPGTGKTVMALYRAARISQRDNIPVTILVYNRPLMLYMQSAISGNRDFRNINIMTYQSWVSDFYKKYLGTSAPKADDNTYEFLWDEVLEDFSRVPNKISHVIIDEAQDFPIELVKGLNIVAKNITCFIDPNQAIEANKTDVIDELIELCIECPVTLTKNYRNTKDIVALSKLYWNGEGYFAESNKLSPGSRKPRIIKCRTMDFDDLNRKTVSIIRNNKGLNIGVLTEAKRLRNTFNALSEELDGEVDVQLYKSSTKDNKIDFSRNGVKVLSFGTMKGLEFDLVIISTLDMISSTGDEFADLNRAYVAITRACSDLVILYFKENPGPRWADVMGQVISNRELLTWM